MLSISPKTDTIVHATNVQVRTVSKTHVNCNEVPLTWNYVHFWITSSIIPKIDFSLIEPTCITDPTPAEETFTFGINDGESPNGIAELDELVTSVDAFSFFRVMLNPTSTNEIRATMTVLGSLTSSGLNIRLKALTEICTHSVLFAWIAWANSDTKCAWLQIGRNDRG